MNIVDISNLKSLVKQLDALLDTYQENYLNLYNEINNSSASWYDSHAINFFKLKEDEKNKINISFEELESFKDLYNLIINSYSDLGNYIEFNIKNRNALLSKLNIYINKLTRVLNSYNSLNYSFASSSIRSAIENQKRTVKNMLEEAKRIRDKIKLLLSTITENEKRIKRTILSINIQVLQQSIIEGCIKI